MGRFRTEKGKYQCTVDLPFYQLDSAVSLGWIYQKIYLFGWIQIIYAGGLLYSDTSLFKVTYFGWRPWAKTVNDFMDSW